MKILAIETSCDEIAAAIVDEHFCVHANVIFSSADLAEKTGGVVPEVAARDAEQKMIPVIQKAMEGVVWDDISAIAVTSGPGLIGSLLVGIEAAKTLAHLFCKPLIPVHHIFGHVCANLLSFPSENPHPLPQFPCVVLTVSGGHNDILLWTSPVHFDVLGSTIDDAAGECFDKCARMLGLPYPGGPSLSQLAQKGDPKKYVFPRPLVNSGNYDFSFSGLKTSLLYFLRDFGRELTEEDRCDIAAGVELAIVETLIAKCFTAVDEYGAKEVYSTGGVSANTLLRQRFLEESQKRGILFRFPKNIAFCTDNAAMIGAAAHLLFSAFPGKKWDPKEVDVNLSRSFLSPA